MLYQLWTLFNIFILFIHIISTQANSRGLFAWNSCAPINSPTTNNERVVFTVIKCTWNLLSPRISEPKCLPFSQYFDGQPWKINYYIINCLNSHTHKPSLRWFQNPFEFFLLFTPNGSRRMRWNINSLIIIKFRNNH
jgi:hypothetical protein